jgi:uncharacterized protein (TIGR04255 family)
MMTRSSSYRCEHKVFSFNRLAPYTTLDDYLPEIERAWLLYVDLVSPVQIRVIRLRYINRMLLPMPANQLDLDEFLEIGPRVPDEEKLVCLAFFVSRPAWRRRLDTKSTWC